MKKIATIHFGAGNIGRGLIAPFFLKNNIHTIFIDKNQELVSLLKLKKQYKICYLDGTSESITKFNIFNSIDEIKEIIGEFDIKFISTSIGVKNFSSIRYDIKNIFELLGDKKEIFLIAFENDFYSSNLLKNELNDKNNNHHYINCLVDRIIPYQNNNKNINIFTEHYSEILLKKTLNVDSNILDKNLKWVDDFEPFLYRKLWIINSTHLMLGYLFNDKKYLYELMDISYQRYAELNQLLDKWFNNISIVLHKKFYFNNDELNEFINLSKKRIFNKEIKDETKRLRRDPIKKLKKNERVMSLLNEFKNYHLDTFILKKLVFKMLTLIDEDDEQSRLIKEYNQNFGLIKTLSHFSGLSEEDAKEILSDFL